MMPRPRSTSSFRRPPAPAAAADRAPDRACRPIGARHPFSRSRGGASAARAPARVRCLAGWPQPRRRDCLSASPSDCSSTTDGRRADSVTTAPIEAARAPRAAAPAAPPFNRRRALLLTGRCVPHGTRSRGGRSADGGARRLRRADTAHPRDQHVDAGHGNRVAASGRFLTHLPQGSRPEGRRRRHARRELPQRPRRSHQGGTTSRTAPDGSRFTSRASSASVTASTAPSTTPTRRGSASPIATVYLTGRDHPQPPRQRAAARHGHPVPERRPGPHRRASATTTWSSCRRSASRWRCCAGSIGEAAP